MLNKNSLAVKKCERTFGVKNHGQVKSTSHVVLNYTAIEVHSQLLQTCGHKQQPCMYMSDPADLFVYDDPCDMTETKKEKQ